MVLCCWPWPNQDKREVLISSAWYPVTGHMGMVQSCARRGLERTLGSNFFTKRVIKHWSRLPREVIDAPSLSVLKSHLDNDLNNML